MNPNQQSQAKVDQKLEDNEDSSEDLQTNRDATSTDNPLLRKEAIKISTGRIRVSDSWQDEAKSEMAKKLHIIKKNFEALCLPATSRGSSSQARRLTHIFQMRCVYAHGGVDLHNRPLLLFPSFPSLHLISEGEFRDVILYLANAKRSFVALIDRRKENWFSVRIALQRLASAELSDIVEKVIILRPEGFFKAAISSICLRLESLPFQVVLLPNVLELNHHVNKDQLTADFDGSSTYVHQLWIDNKLALENFALGAIDAERRLEQFGENLANTQLPNDPISTQTLLEDVKSEVEIFKKELIKIESEFNCLKTFIIKNLFYQELLEDQMKRSLSCLQQLLEETKLAFEIFCTKNLTKLHQCLQLRKFEQEYKEINLYLDEMVPWIKIQTVGVNMSQISSLVEVLTEKERLLTRIQSRINKLEQEGLHLVLNDHYAVDSIQPKCDEIRRKTDSIKKEIQDKTEETNQALQVVFKIEKMSSWCDDVIKILAEQPSEDLQSIDSAKCVFEEISGALTGKEELELTGSGCDSAELQNLWQDTEKRVAGVKRLCEKRLTSVKKGLARLSDRPIQKVEPTTKQACRDNSQKKVLNNRKTKMKSDNLNEKLSHIIDELVTTERTYVEQIESIIKNYMDPFDSKAPEKLKGKKEVLFGNLKDIFCFHKDQILPKLEKSSSLVSCIADVFILEKSNFRLYCDYCCNSSRSEKLRSKVGENLPFFINCQKTANHLLPLGAYLLKPVQRVTKYQLLLEQMLKCCPEDQNPLQKALDSMHDVTKSINDSLHEAAVLGYEQLSDLGKLILQSPVDIHVERRKEKTKRSRFSGKLLRRHLFLYENELVICKQQNRDAQNATSSGEEEASCGILVDGKEQFYHFKRSINWLGMEVCELTTDKKRIEMWRGGEVITLALPTMVAKQQWVKHIKNFVLFTNKNSFSPVRRSSSTKASRVSTPVKEARAKSSTLARTSPALSCSPSSGRKSEDRRKKSSNRKYKVLM